MEKKIDISESVNFLYYETSCNLSTIAKHHNISIGTVSKILFPRPNVVIPRPTQRAKNI